MDAGVERPTLARVVPDHAVNVGYLAGDQQINQLLSGFGVSIDVDTSHYNGTAATIAGAVAGKWAGHRIGNVDFVRPGRSISQIGG